MCFYVLKKHRFKLSQLAPITMSMFENSGEMRLTKYKSILKRILLQYELLLFMKSELLMTVQFYGINIGKQKTPGAIS
jgi:hypothetical protein